MYCTTLIIHKKKRKEKKECLKLSQPCSEETKENA